MLKPAPSSAPKTIFVVIDERADVLETDSGFVKLDFVILARVNEIGIHAWATPTSIL